MVPGRNFKDDTVLAALTLPEQIIMQQVVDKFMSGLEDDRVEFNVWKEHPENLRNAYRYAQKEESYKKFRERKKEEMSRRGYAPPYAEAISLPPQTPVSQIVVVSPHWTETGNLGIASSIGSPNHVSRSPNPAGKKAAPNRNDNPAANGGTGGGRGGYQGLWGRGRGGYYRQRGGYNAGFGFNGRGGYSLENGGGFDTNEPKPVIKPDGSKSINQYVTGEKKYNSRTNGPLCVECGDLGHLPRSCTGQALMGWEKETLR